MQAAATILMIQPAAFGFNLQAGGGNGYKQYSHLPAKAIQEKALEEFDALVHALLKNDINVLVASDTVPAKPSALYPGHWLCTTSNGIITVFPLQAANRRAEKRDDILLALSNKYAVTDVLDLGEYEPENFFLEGTASMAIDHKNRIIYACLSDYTHKTLLQYFARYHNYRAMAFTASFDKQLPVTHTNTILSIGNKFAVICEAAIKDEFERIAVVQLLSTTGHTIVPVSIEQAQQFAGNMLQVQNTKGEEIIVLSKQAFNSLTREQINKLQLFGTLLVVSIPVIENIGGAGIASMMAPIFLPLKQS